MGTTPQESISDFRKRIFKQFKDNPPSGPATKSSTGKSPSEKSKVAGSPTTGSKGTKRPQHPKKSRTAGARTPSPSRSSQPSGPDPPKVGDTIKATASCTRYTMHDQGRIVKNVGPKRWSVKFFDHWGPNKRISEKHFRIVSRSRRRLPALERLAVKKDIG